MIAAGPVVSNRVIADDVAADRCQEFYALGDLPGDQVAGDRMVRAPVDADAGDKGHHAEPATADLVVGDGQVRGAAVGPDALAGGEADQVVANGAVSDVIKDDVRAVGARACARIRERRCAGADHIVLDQRTGGAGPDVDVGETVVPVAAAEAIDCKVANGGVIRCNIQPVGDICCATIVVDLEFGPVDPAERQRARAHGTAGAQLPGIAVDQRTAVRAAVGRAVNRRRCVPDPGQHSGDADTPPVAAAAGGVARRRGNEPHRVSSADGIRILDELPQRALDPTIVRAIVVRAVTTADGRHHVEAEGAVDIRLAGTRERDPRDMFGARQRRGIVADAAAAAAECDAGRSENASTARAVGGQRAGCTIGLLGPDIALVERSIEGGTGRHGPRIYNDPVGTTEQVTGLVVTRAVGHHGFNEDVIHAIGKPVAAVTIDVHADRARAARIREVAVAVRLHQDVALDAETRAGRHVLREFRCPAIDARQIRRGGCGHEVSDRDRYAGQRGVDYRVAAAVGRDHCEAEESLALSMAARIGGTGCEEFDAQRGVCAAVDRAGDRELRAIGARHREQREILQTVRPGVGVVGIVGGNAIAGAELDAKRRVAVDPVAHDGIADGRVVANLDAVDVVAEYQIAVIGTHATDNVAGRIIWRIFVDVDAIAAIADVQRAGVIRAYIVALHDIVVAAVDLDAVAAVAGDDVARTDTRTADDVAAAAIDVDAFLVVAAVERAPGVGADVIAQDLVGTGID